MRLAAILILSASMAMAQPQISGVSGEVAHGEAVVLYGANFGAKSPAAPVFFSDFEEFAAAVGQTVPRGGATGWASDRGAPTIVNDWSHSGSIAVKNGELMRYTSPATGYTELYMTMWLYTTVPVGSVTNWKAPRFGSSGAAGGTGPYSGIGTHTWANPLVQATHVTEEDQVVSITPRPWYKPTETAVYLSGENQGPGYLVNHKQRREAWAKVSTPGLANGVFHYGRISDHASNLSGYREVAIENRPSGEDYLLNAWLGATYPSNSSGDPIDCYMDDLYMDTTPARVEMGNNASFFACTVREIQIPSAWASGQITVTINNNVFDPDETAYLFVVDSNNVPSAGFAVTVGGELEAVLIGPPGTPAVSEIYD